MVSGDAAGDTYTNIEGLHGSRFADDLRGDGNNNGIYGNTGNDQIFGRGGDDKLNGAEGDDMINGQAGNDLLIGGVGADIFKFDIANAGDDVITDFQSGIDTIQLSAATGIISFAELETYVSKQDEDMRIDLEEGGSILILGANALESSDFLFA